MEKKNCFGCRFALESRTNYHTHSEQVRCAKAEALFGGTRWVDFKEEATCGTFEAFQGDDSRAPDVEPPKETVKLFCNNCKGTGFVNVQFYDKLERMKCHKCDGKGNVAQ